MNWLIDEMTQAAARKFPLHFHADHPFPQYGGKDCQPGRWRNVLLPQEVFAAPPAGLFPDSPTMIISDFAGEQYLQALARTISWGAMWRTRNNIYRNHELQRIREALTCCARSIMETHSIEKSWQILTGDAPQGLQWSSVMTSKALHFLCRALHFCQRPPVPIDGRVIRQRVWPRFRDGIPHDHRVGNWNGNGFDAYCRYMTAIITWADARGWTTTEIETTIFAEFQ